MSHFTVLVMFEERPADLEYSLAAVLDRYDENREVQPYIESTREQAVQNEREDIANYRDRTYAEYTADPAAYREKYGYNPAHIDYVSKEFPAEVLPLLEADDEAVFKHVTRFDEPGDRDAEGNKWSRYNPDSKWDWWVIGGRWDNAALPGNMGSVQDVAKPTFAVITPDGEWHEKGHMGWFAMVSEEKDDWPEQFAALVRENKEAFGVVIDAHI